MDKDKAMKKESEEVDKETNISSTTPPNIGNEFLLSFVIIFYNFIIFIIYIIL
jgi:hypothetical protein